MSPSRIIASHLLVGTALLIVGTTLGCSGSDSKKTAGGSASGAGAGAAGSITDAGRADALIGHAGNEVDCTDGADNDGDGLFDCFDADCQGMPTCESSCDDPPVAANFGSVWSDSQGRPAELASSCSDQENSGPEVVYSFTPNETGLLRLLLSSERNLNVSVRRSCQDAQSELGCASRRLWVDVVKDEPVYIVVDAAEVFDAGYFNLFIDASAPACGDGYLDAQETCDDGNTVDGDGCGASCTIESTESSNNDAVASADRYSGSSYIGRVAPAGDVDFVEVMVTEPMTTLIAETQDFDGQSCHFGDMDTELTLSTWDSLQNSPTGPLEPKLVDVARNDNANESNQCSRLVAPQLAPASDGSPKPYYLKVAASPVASVSEFSYRLSVTLDHCGSGRRAETEQCDDGNKLDGDGCSSTCKVEQ